MTSEAAPPPTPVDEAEGSSRKRSSFWRELPVLVVIALALAAPVVGLPWRAWLVVHFALALAVAPWLGRYFDHEPESTVGRLPIRFLVGLPIGFVGGDGRALAACVALIGYGLAARRDRTLFPPGEGTGTIPLLISQWWLERKPRRRVAAEQPSAREPALM